MRFFYTFVVSLANFLFCPHVFADEPIVAELAEIHELKLGPLTIAVDASKGGRISSFKFDGREVLSTKRDRDNWHWGSTVWTSPQSDWKWPPSKTFDQDPFETKTADQNQIVVESKRAPDTALQLTKTVRLMRAEDKGYHAVIKYEFTNHGDQAQQIAIWENTRVRFTGIVRLPPGTTYYLSNPKAMIYTESDENGLSIPLDDRQPDGQKVFCTPPQRPGESTWNHFFVDGLRFSKQRAMPSNSAPGESPLEIYLAPKDGFAELENQGEYAEVLPGASIAMEVIWGLAAQ
jgi:hypothetical protein